VRLNINGDKRLHLTVVDDGVGVGTTGGGHGLSSLRRELREQGGRLQVRAVPTGGTRVLATVPLRG
jgi:signal transduction histidine kinase